MKLSVLFAVLHDPVVLECRCKADSRLPGNTPGLRPIACLWRLARACCCRAGTWRSSDRGFQRPGRDTVGSAWKRRIARRLFAKRLRLLRLRRCSSVTFNNGHAANYCGSSEMCRFCCKSRKLHRSKFLVNSSNATRPTIRITLVALPRSPVNLACGDEVPQIHTRKARLRLLEF